MKIKNQILLLLLLFGVFGVHAQKFGYVNTQELLSNMTEMKLADSQLKAMQSELQNKGEQMVIQFEADYKAYVAEAEKGTLSKILMQQKELELTNKRENIQKFEASMQEELLKKKEELYKPILDKVKMEIEKLGKEGGYTMIFDASAGMILHANETEDLMSALKAKLNIN
jgi:outer membrane protein